MNIHEIPFTIYTTKWQDVRNDPAWPPMFAHGLILIDKLYPFTLQARDTKET